jgi:hypothetical protein
VELELIAFPRKRTELEDPRTSRLQLVRARTVATRTAIFAALMLTAATVGGGWKWH